MEAVPFMNRTTSFDVTVSRILSSALIFWLSVFGHKLLCVFLWVLWNPKTARMSTSGTAGKIVRSNLVIALTGQGAAALVFFVPDDPKGPEKQ
jgi:hypothetical protein